MSQPTIRFIVELKSEKLLKSIDKKTDTYVESVEALPEQQLEYWQQTRDWIDALVPDDDAVFAVRAGVMIVNLLLPNKDSVHGIKALLNGFKPFQITPYTRASNFTYFPDGLDGVGYGTGMSGGSLKKYFERVTASRIAGNYLLASRVASRYVATVNIENYRSLGLLSEE